MMLLALLVNDVAPSLKNNEGANDVMFASKTWQSQHHFPKANIVRRACYRRSPPAAGAIDWSSAQMKNYLYTHAIKVLGGVGASFKKPPQTRPSKNASPTHQPVKESRYQSPSSWQTRRMVSEKMRSGLESRKESILSVQASPLLGEMTFMVE